MYLYIYHCNISLSSRKKEKMEPNKFPVIAKRFWSLVRAALFMLRQGISKKKLMLDLNLKLKRGKIAAARKSAIDNLIFHHSSAAAAEDSGIPPSSSSFTDDAYEFSCENSPANRRHSTASQLKHLTILIKKIKKNLRHSESAHAPPPTEEEILTAAEETASPALPGFGRTPSVRQLRVTDSPFPFRDGDNNDDCASIHVDEAAEKFIRKFYDNLRRQSSDE